MLIKLNLQYFVVPYRGEVISVSKSFVQEHTGKVRVSHRTILKLSEMWRNMCAEFFWLPVVSSAV
jgi:hypothetical protein